MIDARVVRRNTILLAATLTCLSGMVQLVVAVATITLVLVTGIEGILGLGPAIFLTANACAAFPAGRLMDRFGRVPVLAVGCLGGTIGCGVTAAGCAYASATLVIVGFALVGMSQAAILLSRAAAADMYPPERRARGISYVLLGALFGAVLGPTVFRPLLAGKDLDLDALVAPYLAAGGIMIVGLVLVLCVRPDPKKIAETLYPHPDDAGPAAPLGEILRRPGVLGALVAAVASFGVMVAIMNLTGYIVVDHGHHQQDVFTVISAHIVGMYALVLVIGRLIDRLGRKPALVAGLVIEAASVLALVWFSSVAWTSVALFGLGLGWNVAYVAAASELADAARPAERGRLIGLTDFISAGVGATLAITGGVVLSQWGVEVLAVAVTILAAAPAVYVGLRGREPAPPAAELA